MPPGSGIDTTDARTHAAREAGRSSRKTVSEARRRLTAGTGTGGFFDAGLLEEYAGSRAASSFAVPLLVLVLALFASLWVAAHAALAWAAAVIIANTAVVLRCRRFKRVPPGTLEARQLNASILALETVYGLAWSTLACFWLIGEASENLSVAMFSIALVGIAANAISTRTLPGATLATTLPMAGSVAVALLVNGGLLNWSLAAVVLGGEVFFVYLARQLYRSELVSTAHQAEKDALITALEEAREMSEEARRHAEQANIAKSQFLATMSHELRTPLNAIIGFSEVLQSELLGPHSIPQYKEYAGDIQRSGQHLLNLINELLDLSRIEAGKYELNEGAVSLIDIAESCRRMMEMRAKAKGIALSVSYAENLPRIWADERALRQVMLNLLSNAIKFTPHSGKVLLIVTRSADGGQLFAVRDNGPGIPEGEMATVMSSFGQGSLAQKTAEQGAGLGLPIVQKIMELHQGRLDLFSKLNFGTEVIATLPRARVMDALAPVVESAGRLRGR